MLVLNFLLFLDFFHLKQRFLVIKESLFLAPACCLLLHLGDLDNHWDLHLIQNACCTLQFKLQFILALCYYILSFYSLKMHPCVFLVEEWITWHNRSQEKMVAKRVTALFDLMMVTKGSSTLKLVPAKVCGHIIFLFMSQNQFIDCCPFTVYLSNLNSEITI